MNKIKILPTLLALLLVTNTIMLSGCGPSEAERREHARIEAEAREQARIEAERREQARIEAERREQQARIEAERREQARLESLAKQYARAAGEQIMGGVGGGQDLRVQVEQWHFDKYTHEFEVKIQIYFNGMFFRSNHYNVDGILTVNESGSNAKFARSYANSKFEELESNLVWIAGGVIALGVLAEASK
ncbi:hypothetical protein AGMMS50225_22180 [Betaproteobacteria bacterium]|nr:hypothetical protein AGMMS50225_22180 [Betaproteobacteria bacterium]